MTDATDAPLKNSAPGQYLGYGLQTWRALYYLLMPREGAVVSIEHLDDVAVRMPNGETLVEQSKSSIGDKNPVSDWSSDLWKTFSNWVDAVTNNALNIGRTKFCLYVAPENTGTLVKALRDATTAEQVSKAVALVKDTLDRLGEWPTGAKPYLENCLIRNENAFADIVSRFDFEAPDQDPPDVVRTLLLVYVDPEIIDSVLLECVGWVKLQGDRLIADRTPAKLSAAEFQAYLRGLLRRHQSDHILRTFAPPEPDAAQVEGQMVRFYVQQLDLIGCDAQDKLHAVSDFLKASTTRTFWSEKGHAIQQDFDEFDDALWRHWRRIRQRTALTYAALPPSEKGALVYLDCCEHKERLAGKDVPEHVIVGGYHALADAPFVGWHPDVPLNPWKR